MFPEEVGAWRDHMATDVQIVHGFGVFRAVQQADRESPGPQVRGAVAIQPQAKGVGGVEKDLLRRQGDGDVGVRHVQRDVASIGLLLAQRGDHRGRIDEGLRENQPTPAAIDDGIFADIRTASDPAPARWRCPSGTAQGAGVEVPWYSC